MVRVVPFAARFIWVPPAVVLDGRSLVAGHALGGEGPAAGSPVAAAPAMVLVAGLGLDSRGEEEGHEQKSEVAGLDVHHGAV